MMTIQKPQKHTMDEIVKSATMFYMDDALEKEYSDTVDTVVSSLPQRLLGIATLDGLKTYIREDTESLDRIINLLGISEEKFKRIITILRIQKRHTFSTEWPLSKVREQMLGSDSFMIEICELLMKGATSEKYRGLIPKFYLENFFIDITTLGRLASADSIRTLVKKGLEVSYNGKIGESFFKRVTKRITDECDKTGLTYAIKQQVPFIGDCVHIAIPDVNTPRIIIDVVYGITTSSGQTKCAKRAEEIARKIKARNGAPNQNPNVVYVYIVDGAGWVARQSDLGKIERCVDYLFNLHTLNEIGDIIAYYI